MWRLSALWIALLPSLASAQSRPSLEVPLAFVVAEAGGKAVVDASFVARQLERANALFEPHGVRLLERESGRLPAALASLEDRADRDRLAAHLRRGAVTCFVVSSLRDVDDPSLRRRGVHWRKRRDRAGRHYVILTVDALPTTLAHELVHYFGEPGHRRERCNLMSVDRDGCKEWLGAAQGLALQRAARLWLRRTGR